MYIQEASETEAPYNLRVYKCLCTYLNTFSSRQSARPKFANVSSILLLLLFSVFFSISMVDLYNFIPAAGCYQSRSSLFNKEESYLPTPKRRKMRRKNTGERKGAFKYTFTKEQCRIILRKLDGPKISPILFMRSEEDWSFWWLWVTCSRHPSIHPPKTIPSVVCWSVFGAITVLKRTTLSKKNWATLHS